MENPRDLMRVDRMGVFTAIGAANFYFCVSDVWRCSFRPSLDEISMLAAGTD